MIHLLRYQDTSGNVPFTQWFRSLRDKQAAARISMRLRRLQQGNFGDCKPVGEGVRELRVHVGAGYRIYFARHGATVVLLLCGGSKASQKRDIEQAQQFWVQWKKEQRS